MQTLYTSLPDYPFTFAHVHADDLLPETSTGLEHLLNRGGSSTKGTVEPAIVVVYVHPLKTGLYRIHICGK